ncbi:hypothetical protein ONZ51_g5829 [Trametes cubensis]|uniref:Uncharacterized protein n=1 Tax=Trametes cubensis TaxID=1111947 RepID=A0AAD7XB51_9APHY|nr:hypothetical protein ONZ51_g5829 [Trametes cubensis]
MADEDAEERARIQRSKELRRARNQRHRQKLKDRKQDASRSETSDYDASIPSRGPISIPLTPNNALTSVLASLNARLRAWGFHEDRNGIRESLERAWHTAEADGLLDEIAEFLGSGMLDTLSAEASCALWASITSTVFKVQWAVAVLEALLDIWTIPVVP